MSARVTKNDGSIALQWGEAVTAGASVSIRADGKGYLANASDTAAEELPVVGFAECDGAAGDYGNVVYDGIIEGASNLTPGEWVYQADTDGAVSAIAGTTEQVVGRAFTASKFVIDLRRNDTGVVPEGSISPAELAAAATYTTTIRIPVAGDITASIAAKLADIARGAGKIVRAGFALGNTGEDASNPLAAELDVLIGAASIFTTKPAIDKTAADGADTFTAGTGVTVGVLDATKVALVANNKLNYSLTMTRTASPSDEMADAYILIDVAYKVGV